MRPSVSKHQQRKGSSGFCGVGGNEDKRHSRRLIDCLTWFGGPTAFILTSTVCLCGKTLKRQQMQHIYHFLTLGSNLSENIACSELVFVKTTTLFSAR